MKKYLLLMVGEEMPVPKDKNEAEAMMKPWVEWMDGLTKSGNMEDGLPVQRNGKAVSKTGVKDYKAHKEDIGGYVIVKANSLDEAVKIAQSSPYAKMGMGTTIVRECMEMQM